MDEDGPDEHLDRVGRPVEVPDAGGRAKTRGEVKPQKHRPAMAGVRDRPIGVLKVVAEHQGPLTFSKNLSQKVASSAQALVQQHLGPGAGTHCSGVTAVCPGLPASGCPHLTQPKSQGMLHARGGRPIGRAWEEEKKIPAAVLRRQMISGLFL